MKQFNIGDKVLKIDNGELKRGWIVKVYDAINPVVYAVDFGGVIEKCYPSVIAEDVIPEKTEVEAPVITKELILETTAIVAGELAEIISYKDVLLIKDVIHSVIGKLFPVIEND